MLEFEVEVPAEMAEEFDKKLAYIAEGIESAIYDPDRRRVRVRLGEGKVTSQEVLEARVSEIAQKLRSGYQPGIRRQLAHRVRRSREVRSDPHPLLVANGDLHEFGRGRFGLGPKLVALVRALDELIVNRFSDMNPRAHQFPSLISGEVLDRCRYLRNFPASLTMVAHLREDLAVLQDFASQVRWNEDHLQVPPESASPFSVLLAPSVCFHWYAWLGNRQVEGPSVVTRTAARSLCSGCWSGSASPVIYASAGKSCRLTGTLPTRSVKRGTAVRRGVAHARFECSRTRRRTSRHELLWDAHLFETLRARRRLGVELHARRRIG